MIFVIFTRDVPAVDSNISTTDRTTKYPLVDLTQNDYTLRVRSGRRSTQPSMITRTLNRSWCCISASMTFDAPPVAGAKKACEECLMSKVKRTAAVQSVVYADVYAIIIPHTIHHDYDEPTFVSANGETTWPCRARLFDSAKDAGAAKVALGLPPDATVVRLRLTYTAEAVEMATTTKRPGEIRMRRRRVA